MKTMFLMLFAFAAWSGCTLGQLKPAASDLTDEANLAALEFGDARSAAIANLKGQTKTTDGFHGYQRVTAWRTANAATAAEIAALMSEIVRADLAIERRPHPDGELVRLHSFCFNPGYGVRLGSDRGPRDFLVCLECDEMYVFDEASHLWNHHLERTESAKLATLLGGT